MDSVTTAVTYLMAFSALEPKVIKYLCEQAHKMTTNQVESSDKFLETHDGKEWLLTEDGCIWLKSPVGQQWLSTSIGRSWITAPTSEYGHNGWIYGLDGYPYMMNILQGDDFEWFLATDTGIKFCTYIISRDYCYDEYCNSRHNCEDENNQCSDNVCDRCKMRYNYSAKDFLETVAGKKYIGLFLNGPNPEQFFQLSVVTENWFNEHIEDWSKTEIGKAWLYGKNSLRMLMRNFGTRSNWGYDFLERMCSNKVPEESQYFLASQCGRVFINCVLESSLARNDGYLYENRSHQFKYFYKTELGKIWLDQSINTPDLAEKLVESVWFSGIGGYVYEILMCGESNYNGEFVIDYTMFDKFLVTVAGKLWKLTKQGMSFFQSPPSQWIFNFASLEWLLSSESIDYLTHTIADDEKYYAYKTRPSGHNGLLWKTRFTQSPNGKIFIETIKSSTIYVNHIDPFIKDILAIDNDWLISKYGVAWMMSKSDTFWNSFHFAIFSQLDSKNSFTLFSFTSGKVWSQSLSFQNWINRNFDTWLSTVDGLFWLTTPNGITWGFSYDSFKWLSSPAGQNFIQSTTCSEYFVIKQLKLSKYTSTYRLLEEFILSDIGNTWLNTIEGVSWLKSSIGNKYENLQIFRNELPLI